MEAFFWLFPLSFAAIAICILAFQASQWKKKALEHLQDLRERPNSIELDEFLSDLARHGHGALRVQALRVDEILLRARPKL